MVSNSDVAKTFANTVRKSKSRSMFIEDKTVYSYGYHYPIAKKISGKRVLVNSYSSSVTTNKHKSLVQSSLRSGTWEIIEIFSCDKSMKDKQIKSNNTEIKGLKKQLNNPLSVKGWRLNRIGYLRKQNRLLRKL